MTRNKVTDGCLVESTDGTVYRVHWYEKKERAYYCTDLKTGKPEFIDAGLVRLWRDLRPITEDFMDAVESSNALLDWLAN